MSEANVEPALSRQANFRYGEVSTGTTFRARAVSAPSLGPLTAFAGTFMGRGLNTIFRPNSTKTPTGLPTTPVGPDDNVLELNLTSETLSFSAPLGNVPNRASGQQPDAFLNGVPYLQSISDVTVPSQPVGIHFEPGLWIAVPETDIPQEGPTVARMASIPHGTTIEAQGTYSTAAGKPTIPVAPITPFVNDPAQTLVTFPSQTATTSDSERIPQNLAPFIAAGTITQAILEDPNTVLRNAIATQNVTSTTTIQISTKPAAPLFGGGTDNIAFLLGDPAATTPNADTTQMSATFWIETVQYEIEVPVMPYGTPPRRIPAPTGEAGQPVPVFLVDPPYEITVPRSITVTTTQIQYSQRVLLVFAGLVWPHVSVATLVPADPIPIPPSAWA